MSPLPEQAVDPAVTAHIRRQLAAGDFDGTLGDEVRRVPEEGSE